jgi:two-component system, NtrC family, response regulator HydG
MEFHSEGRGMTLRNLVNAYERRLIEDALRATGGNQRQAARSLGVLPTTLHEKMKRLGLVRRARPTPAPPMALAG